jgi:hypothetical protein
MAQGLEKNIPSFKSDLKPERKIDHFGGHQNIDSMS